VDGGSSSRKGTNSNVTVHRTCSNQLP